MKAVLLCKKINTTSSYGIQNSMSTNDTVTQMHSCTSPPLLTSPPTNAFPHPSQDPANLHHHPLPPPPLPTWPLPWLLTRVGEGGYEDGEKLKYLISRCSGSLQEHLRNQRDLNRRAGKEYVQDIVTHLARIDSIDEEKRSYLVQGLGDEHFRQVCMTTCPFLSGLHDYLFIFVRFA